MLRPYQQSAHDESIAWIKQSIDPCLIEAATGAGKTHIIAAIANTVHKASGGKHVLCLAPSAELVEQNHEKFEATGNKASIFSASAGKKCLRHPVVFGTPGTVKNRISRFGSQFALVIIDECHELTPTIKEIIEAIKNENHKLRVIGLSATPYRLGEGYIYATDEKGKPTGNPDAYFIKKIFTISAPELISLGYLTPPVIGPIHAEQYKTLHMEVNSRGQFDGHDVDRAYHGHGRKTSLIVADIVEQAKDRNGVMIFAATVQHAEEVMASLPPELSAIVHSGTKKADRKNIIKRFKSKQIKYIVNVSVLTKGFDAPHVDLIAILRATESVALLQQIIGRGLRLYDGKKDCLILDYAENIERHSPDGDIFNPSIKNKCGEQKNGSQIKAICPSCSAENLFTPLKNEAGYQIDNNGYYLDLDGNRIETEYGPMSAHYGRRCQGFIRSNFDGRYMQCDYRWTYKPCPHCDAENDIAARYCISCKGEIIDPNEKLKIEFRQLKRDPTIPQTDNVVELTPIKTLTASGKDCVRVDIKTEYRQFSIWYTKTSQRRINEFMMFKAAYQQGIKTVSYQKDISTGFYRIIAFNRKADEIPTVA